MPRRGSSCPSSAERRAGAALLVVLALALGCARQGLPPGGPKDLESPLVVAVEPDSGATRVALDAAVAITFSEPMERASVLDWVLLSPPRDFGHRDWKGNTFRLSGGEDFAPDVTTTVVVGTGCRDERERNSMVAPYLFVFSTGDSVDQGRIDGRLLAKGQRAQGTMVWAVDLERAAARPDTLLPDYITQAGSDSTFSLIGLKAGRRYRVLAHFDSNRDREFDRATEFLAAYPESLWLDPAHPVASGVAIDYRDPRASGSIAGTVVDSTRGASPPDSAAAPDTTAAAPDSLAAPLRVEAWLRLRAVPEWDTTRATPAEPDTTAAAAAQADSLGAFELRNLAPGLYRVEAFLDRDRNRRYDAGEPRAAPADSVRVIPLEKTAGVHLVVRATP